LVDDAGISNLNSTVPFLHSIYGTPNTPCDQRWTCENGRAGGEGGGGGPSAFDIDILLFNISNSLQQPSYVIVISPKLG
jgi:hypothetical protein